MRHDSSENDANPDPPHPDLGRHPRQRPGQDDARLPRGSIDGGHARKKSRDVIFEKFGREIGFQRSLSRDGCNFQEDWRF